MSLVNDARRLAAQSVHEPYAGDHCVFCAGRRNVDDHLPHCPWLAMPRIVAALELAEQLVRHDPSCDGPECNFCDARIRSWREEEDRPVKVDLPHESGCPWQALVSALRVEGVTA